MRTFLHVGCIVVCPLWLEMPLRAALIVAAPHFTHVPFRIRGNLLDARAPIPSPSASAPEITSQKSVKHHRRRGCGPLTIVSEEMNSPVFTSNVSAKLKLPASRSTGRARSPYGLLGRPLERSS